ncbi:ABC transporter permease [Conexibacter arvalis]|uniref:ABC-2 type transport system permease protein n=1 Tax=Conexibacter arvalis TaxID=912552 RepID=A0A840I7C3_9ACTN|nr:ABC transporter permease [Conexibacter arvalis]MBB4660757.1 ABC-2 type transport system permease protein [Conexibacter arvalis]
MTLTYLRYELLRTVRNGRFFVFSLGIPLIIYVAIAGPNANEENFEGLGLSVPLYYMVGIAGFGAMMATISCGGRIAAERSVGWNRQLRITPLKAPVYLGAKVATAYAMALLTIVLLYAAGFALGVRLPVGEWVAMTALMLVGLVPFAALGVTLGHLLTADSIGPVMGGVTSLLALLGGTWFPITSGAMLDIARCLPSYWLVQASHVGVGGDGWSAQGWAVVAAWSVVLTALAVRAYRRDTVRV